MSAADPGSLPCMSAASAAFGSGAATGGGRYGPGPGFHLRRGNRRGRPRCGQRRRIDRPAGVAGQRALPGLNRCDFGEGVHRRTNDRLVRHAQRGACHRLRLDERRRGHRHHGAGDLLVHVGGVGHVAGVVGIGDVRVVDHRIAHVHVGEIRAAHRVCRALDVTRAERKPAHRADAARLDRDLETRPADEDDERGRVHGPRCDRARYPAPAADQGSSRPEPRGQSPVRQPSSPGPQQPRPDQQRQPPQSAQPNPRPTSPQVRRQRSQAEPQDRGRGNEAASRDRGRENRNEERGR